MTAPVTVVPEDEGWRVHFVMPSAESVQTLPQPLNPQIQLRPVPVPVPVPEHETVAVLCPLCDRPIPASQQDAHHLVPKSHGGVWTVVLHRICHPPNPCAVHRDRIGPHLRHGRGPEAARRDGPLHPLGANQAQRIF